MINPKKVIQGRRSRVQGAEFEKRVRIDIEENGWTVDKWTNNVSDYPNRKLIKAKAKWSGPNRPMMMGAGFPDFIVFKQYPNHSKNCYNIIGVESKMSGVLDKEEKEKCDWLLKNNIFSKILIAEKTKVKNKVVIIYHNFQEKYGNNKSKKSR